MVNCVFFKKKLDRNLLRSTTFEHLTFEQTTYDTKCYNHRNWFVCISSLLPPDDSFSMPNLEFTN